MSFDLYFMPWRFDGTTVREVNPFTKKARHTPRSKPLSGHEVLDVLAVIERAAAGRPPECGVHVLEFEDGGGCELFGIDSIYEGCSVSVRRDITPQFAGFLFDLLKAGRWVLVSTGDEDVVLASDASFVSHVPEDYPQVVVCRSPAELGECLALGVILHGAILEHIAASDDTNWN